jgi:L-2-hydroxyglutarate oxidase LhgO
VVVVVGAGVVGLASALALSQRGRAVCVIERHPRAGQDTSTHNSGVIHGGLYHPPGSLKTLLCHEGRERIYAFCRKFDVPHARCGKVIVAAPGEEAELQAVARAAAANGVRLEELDAHGLRQREPYVSGIAALWSAETGWLEAEAYVRQLAGEAQRLGAVILCGTPVVAIEPESDTSLTVVTPRERIEASAVVNAAGLFADDVSRIAGGEPFTIYPCRGEYAELAPRARHLVRGLVYPVPHPSGHGLGVHLTRTIGGAVWIGPTIHYQHDKADYERDRLPLAAFLEPTRRLLPDVTADDLRLGGSGLRAKLHPPEDAFADFLIRRDVRVPALIHAAGIDSPGLTASLAIGERVAGIVESG